MKTFTTRNDSTRYSTDNPTEQIMFVDFFDTVIFGRITAYTPLLDGQPHGKLRYVYNNGQIRSEINHVKGKRVGPYKQFNEDGSIHSQGYFLDDLLHGECIKTNNSHRFYVNNMYIEDLDYLVHEERNDEFYVTLSLYGIFEQHLIRC